MDTSLPGQVGVQVPMDSNPSFETLQDKNRQVHGSPTTVKRRVPFADPISTAITGGSSQQLPLQASTPKSRWKGLFEKFRRNKGGSVSAEGANSVYEEDQSSPWPTRPRKRRTSLVALAQMVMRIREKWVLSQCHEDLRVHG